MGRRTIGRHCHRRVSLTESDEFGEGYGVIVERTQPSIREEGERARLAGMQPRPRIRVTSSGGVVYRWEKESPLFLLLGSNGHGVECLPQAHIEENEDEVTTAMREVREEPGRSR